MQLAVLSFQSQQFHDVTQAELLQTVAEQKGHMVTFLRWDSLTWTYATDAITVMQNGAPLPQFDAILVRPRVYGDPSTLAAALQALQDTGQVVVNSAAGILNAKNKVRQHGLLARNGIATPATHVLYGTDQLDTLSLAWPVVIKSVYGAGGVGVFYAADLQTARPIVDFLTKRGFDDPAIVQEYIATATQDIRAFVVGAEVVASMQRTAKEGEFRANIHQGADGEAIVLTDKEVDLALRAARACDLDIAGVDLARTDAGPLVLEVNANPFMTGITNATGIPVAEHVVAFAVQKAQSRSSDRGNA